VILPGLGKGSPRENTELFLYHEGLVAPIRESGGEKDPIYGYLQEIEKRKSANELVRLLYVATTRAKKRLHLLGFAGTNGKPPHGSFLSVLWLGLNEEERQLFINAAEGSPKELIDEVTVPIRRLPLNWEAPVGAAPLHWERRNDRVEPDRQPTFEWAGDNLRHAGTVVHAILQRIAKDSGYRALPLAIRTSLAQLGVPADDLDPTASRVESAIAKTVASRRGQWILGPQKEAHCELTVNAQLEGKILSGRIDRTFIDSDGTRWVIDFKTSWHEGGRLAAFLDEQQRRYTGQMERYGQLFKGLGAPVRLGLYFPLLDEWREWGI
jgi:ATP-dependent helicase/nuclease subunit A